MDPVVDRYIAFQREAASPFHAVTACLALLRAAGFQALDATAAWQLEDGKNYYVCHPDGKTVVAFLLRPTAPRDNGFAIAAAHTDSPVLRLRSLPWEEESGYGRLLTQLHGGLIFRAWLDRPLVLAGAIYSLERSDGKIKYGPTGLPQVTRRLVQTTRPLAIIPDLAIHLDREKNKAGEINAESALAAICGQGGEASLSRLWELLGCSDASIDGFELSFAPFWPHQVVGMGDEFIVGPRHDDLAMVFAIVQSLVAASVQRDLPKTVVATLFDAEETGSTTASGAASLFVRDTLRRIATAPCRGPVADLVEGRVFANSFLVSADMSHGFHPSHSDKHDRLHRPRLNGGVVIKENANDRYATGGYERAVFRGICERAGVPTQEFVIRQDLACGSTVGPILAAQLGCPTIDIGTAMWGMHSTAETMGAMDLEYAVKAISQFYYSHRDVS